MLPTSFGFVIGDGVVMINPCRLERESNMTRHPVFFLSFSRADSAKLSALIRLFKRMMHVRYSVETNIFPASPLLHTEGRPQSGVQKYLFKRLATGGWGGHEFVKTSSGVFELSTSNASVVIVWSVKLGVGDGPHRRRPDIFINVSTDAGGRPALPLTLLTQRARDALSRVKAYFLPGFADDGQGTEARALHAAARRAAIAESDLHEVAHWCDHAPLQSRRLAASMAATGAPGPRTAVPGTPDHLWMSAFCDFGSAVPLWPTGLNPSVGPVKGLPVLPALPHGAWPFLDAGGIACALSNQNHDLGNAGKGAMFRYVATYPCRDTIETLPAGTSRQFGGVDMRVPVRGGLLPADWQPDFPGPVSRGLEAAARPVPVPVTAASAPITAADRWVGGLLCKDQNADGVCCGFEILGGAGDWMAGTNGTTGFIVSDPDPWELLGGGSGSDFGFFDGCRNTLDGGAGNDIFAFQGSWNGHDTIADFGIRTGHDSVDLWTAFSQNFLVVEAKAVTPSRTPDVALARSKDAGLHPSYTGWITDAATGLRREGPLIDWDAAAVRRKSNAVSCEITDLFEDDTTAGIFPRRARDLFYGREISPGDTPAGRADAETGTGVINFASRKSKRKKTPDDIPDAAAARQ
jgi:hypothetical protein